MKKILVATLVMLTGWSGCFGAQTISPTRYYPVVPAITVNAAEAAPFTLGVRPLAAARPYRMPVAYLDDSGLMLFRSNDSWAELPGDTATRAVQDALRETGRFEDVGDAADMARPHLILTGELRKFHELREASSSHAEVELYIEVREVRGARLIWSGAIHVRETLAGSGMPEIAEAMGQALGRAVSQAANAIAGASL